MAGYRSSSPPGPSAAMPVVDIPISREVLTEADLIVPTWSEFTDAVEADYELHIYKQWLETDQVATSAASVSPIAQTGKLQEQHIKYQLVLPACADSNNQLSRKNNGLQRDLQVQTYQQQLLGSIGPTIYSLRVLPERYSKIRNYSTSDTSNSAESNASCRKPKPVRYEEEQQRKVCDLSDFQAVQQSRPSTSLADADIAIPRERLQDDYLIVATCPEFGGPAECDSELSQVSKWLESTQVPTQSSNRLIDSFAKSKQLGSWTTITVTPLRATEGSCEIARTSGELRVNNSRTQSLMQWSTVISIKPELETAGVDRLDSRTLSTTSLHPRTLSAVYDSCRPRRNSKSAAQTRNLRQSELLGPSPKSPKTTYTQFQQHSKFSTYSTSSTHSTGDSDAPNSNFGFSKKEGEKSEYINFEANQTPGPSTETTRTRSPQSSTVQHYSTSGTPRGADSNESNFDLGYSSADGGKRKNSRILHVPIRWTQCISICGRPSPSKVCGGLRSANMSCVRLRNDSGTRVPVLQEVARDLPGPDPRCAVS